MAKKKYFYSKEFSEKWKEFCEQAHDSDVIDAQGYMMISMAVAYVADELAEIKTILSQKGVK